MSETWPAIPLKSLEEAMSALRSGDPNAPRQTWDCPPSQFMAAMRVVYEEGARLLTLSAGRRADELILTYTFEVGNHASLVVRTRTHERCVESLFSSFPAADYLEREVNTLFGVKFLGHPNLARREVAGTGE